MQNDARTITAPMSVGEWGVYWNETHHVDGLLGLLHGIHRFRPEKEGSGYADLVQHLVDLARRVVFTGDSQEDAKLGLWQEVYHKAAERLIFSVMGGGVLPRTMDHINSHEIILKFMGEGLINIFSQQQHLEAAGRYLAPMISQKKNDDRGERETVVANWLHEEIVRAASAWGLAPLFLTRNPRIAPELVITRLKQILQENSYDPDNSLSPDRCYTDLDLPHHVVHGTGKKFGAEFALYRTARVYLMLQQRERERASVAVP